MNQNKPRENGLFDVNFELLFWRPQWHLDNPVLQFILTPRPRIGASINTGHGTSQASFGLAWDAYIYRNIFIEFSAGIALHNGYTGVAPAPDNMRLLGCNPLFRQSLWVGGDINRHWRVMVGIEHLDNFGLCHENAGLSNLGVRVGYRF